MDHLQIDGRRYGTVSGVPTGDTRRLYVSARLGVRDSDQLIVTSTVAAERMHIARSAPRRTCVRRLESLAGERKDSASRAEESASGTIPDACHHDSKRWRYQ
jgi:hypothetical protein